MVRLLAGGGLPSLGTPGRHRRAAGGGALVGNTAARDAATGRQGRLVRPLLLRMRGSCDDPTRPPLAASSSSSRSSERGGGGSSAPGQGQDDDEASSGDGGNNSNKEARRLEPAKLKPLAATVGVGLAVLAAPRPEALSAEAWKLLALFLSTITGVVLQPVPMGAVALMGLGAAVAAGVLEWSAAFAAFSAEVPWLIAFAMFIAQGFRKTGLGARLAFGLVAAVGGRGGPVGLAYSLAAAEALLSPLIPSVAARAGGVLLPVTVSLAEASGSRAGDGTEGRLGTYLVSAVYQCSVVSSAMFLTANHPNPLSAQLALATVGVTLGWGAWATAAVVPGLLSLLILPPLIYRLFPPTSPFGAGSGSGSGPPPDTSQALAAAKRELEALGPMSAAEGTMSAILAGTLLLWVFGGPLGVSPGLAALGGLSAMLLTGVLAWDDCLGCKGAWNTLTWFAALIALSGALKSSGLVAYFSDGVAASVAALGLGWEPSFIILLLVYIASHVFFASNIAHVSAMLAAFLSVAVAAGAPPPLAAICFACFSNMMGGFTPYGMSHAPMYFGSGYVTTRQWWSVGLAALAANLAVWLVAGGAWWKVIGLW